MSQISQLQSRRTELQAAEFDKWLGVNGVKRGSREFAANAYVSRTAFLYLKQNHLLLKGKTLFPRVNPGSPFPK